MSFTNLLKQACIENNLSVNETAIAKLAFYLELMQTWNRAFNLTTITHPRGMVYLHIIDSLLIQPYLQGNRMLDVGSGAGLPGIPLAITNPQTHWVLLDKNSKKTRFLTQAIAELGLTNVETAHDRSEDFHSEQGFDSILSRALSTLSLFMESTAHLLNVNGKFIAMKGKHPQEEMAELSARFNVENVTRLEIKGMDVDRHVVIASLNKEE